MAPHEGPQESLERHYHTRKYLMMLMYEHDRPFKKHCRDQLVECVWAKEGEEGRKVPVLFCQIHLDVSRRYRLSVNEGPLKGSGELIPETQILKHDF